jgi:hypothetical protein
MMTLPLPRCSVLFQDTISHLLLSPSAGGSSEIDRYESTPPKADAIVNDNIEGERQSDPFANSKQIEVNRSSDYGEQYVHSGHDRCDGVGLFQFGGPDVASRGIYNSNSMNQSTSHNEDDMNKTCHDFIGEEPFDVMDLYAGSNDGHSILEPTSNASDYGTQTVYKYSTPVSHLKTKNPEAYHSHLPKTNRARPGTQHSDLSASVVNYHRPLALRSFGSEAQIQSRLQNHPNMYATNMSPPFSYDKFSRRREVHQTSEYPLTPPTEKLAYDRTGLSMTGIYANDQPEQIPVHDGFEICSHHDPLQIASETMMDLAAFPIPPMRNPVGELPMLLHRVASHPPDATTGQAVTVKSTSTTPSVAETYRAITKVHMVDLLKRTRSRGAQLSSIDWQSLSIPERVWREQNGTIIVSIYGRHDVELSDHDVEYVNCVARELRADGNGISSNEWILHMLRDDL